MLLGKRFESAALFQLLQKLLGQGSVFNENMTGSPFHTDTCSVRACLWSTTGAGAIEAEIPQGRRLRQGERQ